MFSFKIFGDVGLLLKFFFFWLNVDVFCVIRFNKVYYLLFYLYVSIFWVVFFDMKCCIYFVGEIRMWFWFYFGMLFLMLGFY